MYKYRIADGKTVRVAVSGKSGCGNTTVSTLLAKMLGVRLINYTFRTLAGETGLSLAEIIEKARTDDSFDKTVDTRQVELAREGSCVLGSRLAIWMLKEADLKVYLIACGEERAKRIHKREGGDIKRIREFTKMRDREDTIRYKRLYDIDDTDFSVADISIDTAGYSPEAIAEMIAEELCARSLAIRCGKIP